MVYPFKYISQNQTLTIFKNPKTKTAYMPKLSIVIPAMNESERLPQTLKSYLNFFDTKLKDEYEVVIVSNNCKDDTPDVVENLKKQYPQIIHSDKYSRVFTGKGGAVIEGFKIAQGDHIGFVDADGSTPAEYFYDLYHNIENKDGVIASRWIEGAEIGKKQNFKRIVASRTFNLMVRNMFGLKIKDSQCGAKLFKKKAIKSILDQTIIKHWAFDVDLLYALKRKGFNVKEIPTKWDDKAGSVLNLNRASKNMLRSIITLRLYHSPLKNLTKKWIKK